MQRIVAALEKEREKKKKIKVFNFYYMIKRLNFFSFDLNFIRRIYVISSIILMVPIYNLTCFLAIPTL